MKNRQVALALSCTLTSTSFAEADVTGIDVPKWFDGCVELVQQDSYAAGEMDTDCIVTAVDYCQIGRTQDKRKPCIDDLIAVLQAKTIELLNQKPDPADLSNIQKRGFERSWRDAAQSDRSDGCLSKMQDLQLCEMFSAVLRWTSARSAWRIWKRNQE